MSGCPRPSEQDEEAPTREDALPHDAVKVTPEMDIFPPVFHWDGWEDPLPLEGPINTAGAEDSPFITPDDDTLYFFFTPDVNKPPNEQLLDGVTGIWWSKVVGGTWTEPERIVLSDNVSLDGCPFVQGDTLWFCSVRSGNYGEVDFYRAECKNGKCTDWENAGQRLNEQYDVGEVHISPDGSTMYFGSSRPGGFGRMDIWKSKINGQWGDPINLGSVVNSERDEYQPFITQDGNELWFTGQSLLGNTGPSIFRSERKNNGDWSEPEEIISNFAGEPTLDSQGNIHFVHHFFNENMGMIEADIYVAYRK